MAEALKQEELPDVLGRWSRYLHRLVMDGRAHGSSSAFYDTLIEVRRMALVNTGLNKQMQLERLLLAWRELDLDL